jgi:hypothetical protein
MFCSKCGEKLSTDALFCNNCGNKISSIKIHNAPAMPNNGTASLFQKYKKPIFATAAVLVVLGAFLIFGGGSAEGTYKNGRQGFSFDYPEDWSIEELTSDHLGNFNAFTEVFGLVLHSPIEEEYWRNYGYYMFFGVIKADEPVTADNWKQIIRDDISITARVMEYRITADEVSIGGVTAIKETRKDGGDVIVIYYFYVGGNILVVHYWYNTSHSPRDAEAVYETIVNSVKITKK